MLGKCASTPHDTSTDYTKKEEEKKDGWYLLIHRRDMLVILPSNGKSLVVTSKAHGNHPRLVLPLFLCDRHEPVDHHSNVHQPSKAQLPTPLTVEASLLAH
jgi:hypothetical protein